MAKTMTDRELVFILLTVMSGDLELIVTSLVLLKRNSALTILEQCRDELIETVKGLNALIGD